MSKNEVLKVEVTALESITNIEVAESVIKKYKDVAGESLYRIGQILDKVQKDKLTDDIVKWGTEKFGFKKAYIYQLIKVSNEFTTEQFNLFGASKLAQIGTNARLIKLEQEKGVSPESSLSQIKDSIHDLNLEARGETPKEKNVTPRKLSPKQEAQRVACHNNAMKRAIDTLLADGKTKEEIRTMFESLLQIA